LFELKYFFSTGVQSTKGEEKVSARSIKKMIEELVANEDPTRPLSDEAIAQILQEQGICISAAPWPNTATNWVLPAPWPAAGIRVIYFSPEMCIKYYYLCYNKYAIQLTVFSFL